MNQKLTPAPRSSRLRWLPLYLLGLLAVALFALDWALPLSEAWRSFLLFALAGLVCALAAAWSRRNADLLRTEGVNGKVERDLILEGLRMQARPAEEWEDEEAAAAKPASAPTRPAYPARTAA